VDDTAAGHDQGGNLVMQPKPWTAADAAWMRRALDLAARGQGFVEPNPLVGCVIVRDGELVGEGHHQKFGGPHAEVHALCAAGDRARGATVYVSLEPCSHHGKTPPCVDSLLAAGVGQVISALSDPFPEVAGRGFGQLAASGVQVAWGLLEAEARRLNAPYLKLLESGRPWIIGKWAMTLDGKIAAHTGDSRWITSPAARAMVHQLRGRVDAILVGRGTAERDDPLLTARPPGPRVATRIVLDRKASLASSSQLVKTAPEIPVLIVVGKESSEEDRARLTAAGCEVWLAPGDDAPSQLAALFAELGHRRMTNVLVEGGGQVLGSLFDAGLLDEVLVFIAAKLIGGAAAPSPCGGIGRAEMGDALPLIDPVWLPCGPDLLCRGLLSCTSPPRWTKNLSQEFSGDFS